MGAFPAPLTSLVGRESDTAAVRELLMDDGVRLLTLVGPGGVGKTRLALSVTGTVTGHFPGGIAFVPLAPIRDPDLVLHSIGKALDVREEGGGPLADRLASAIGAKRLLLVLDNFEQVRSAASAVAALLAACPALVVLVTSRARLRVGGEQHYPVSPLALPPRFPGHGAEPSASLAVIAASPAVQLFVRRVQGGDPCFTLDAGNAETIAAICHRLDGLPLAIELAAARLRVLSPQELAARLDLVLPLLTDGPVNAPDRLRTMRSAIAWSYDLLTAEEQRTFRRLGVFVGGFTLDAAGAVVDSRTSLPIDLIASLLDTSLVQRTTVKGESHFAWLETIREFALERLEASDEADEVRRTHATWFARLAEAASTRIHGPDGAAMLAQIEVEEDNLRAALSWTIASGETDLALRLAYAAWRFWWMRSQLDQGRTWLERALALPDVGPTTVALRPKVQVAAGYFARVQGDYERAVALGDAALDLARQIGDAQRASAALHLLSLVAADRGDLAEAQEFLEASIAIDRAEAYAHGVAFGLSNLGDIFLARGRLADAAAHADEALAIWRARGDAWGVAWALIGRARIARAEGHGVDAETLVDQALAECARLGDKEIAARGIAELAAIIGERGDLHRAVRLHGIVAALREAIGAPVAPSERASHAAAVAAIRNRLTWQEFSTAWETGRAVSPDRAVAAASTVEREGRTVERGEITEPRLTPRERAVLRLLVAGHSDKEIAAALSISRHTVSKHVAAILAKLDVVSRTAAVAAAFRHGLD